MKICIVSPYFPSRHMHACTNKDAGLFLLREAEKLMKRGHKFFVVACRHHGLPEFEIIEGIPVYRVSSVIIPKIRYPIPNLFQLINTIINVSKKYSIDLLNFWSQVYLTSLPVLFLKKITKVPIAVTVGGFPGVDWFYGNKIVDLVGLIHSLFLAGLILRRANRIRTEFFSVNKFLLKLGIPNSKIHVIRRGVDIERFRPIGNRENAKKELGIKKNNVVILFVGRLDQVKGIDYLIQAAKQLLKEYNYLTFMFAGEGTLRRKYEEMTQGIRENVIFLGYRNDVCQLMNAADIFVLPSRSEAHPISVLEANACGLPVVASRVGGVPEMIMDGVNGVCVTPKNAYKLTEALRKLTTNPSLAKKMGKKGRAFVKQCFSEEIVASKVEKYYQQIIERNRKQSIIESKTW